MTVVRDVRPAPRAGSWLANSLFCQPSSEPANVCFNDTKCKNPHFLENREGC